MADTCPSCKSTHVENGSLLGAAVQLDRASAMKKIVAAPEVKALVCLDCGRITGLRADPRKLARLLGMQ